MGGSSIIQVGVTAITAAQVGLRTVGHNIANVNTPGYSRQVLSQGAQEGEFSGGGFIGKGVKVTAVTRQYDAFLVSQARNTSSQVGMSSTYLSQLTRLNDMLGNESTGLGQYLTNFYSSLQQLAQNPTDVASRIGVLGAANGLAQRARDIDAQLAIEGDQVNQAITTDVQQVNTLMNQIATLNDQIAKQTASGAPPNDAMDQRDLAITNLSKIVRVNTVDQGDGSVNVYLSNGQALVVANQKYALQLQADSLDPSRLLVGFGSGSSFKSLPIGTLTGGSLAGYMNYRDVELTNARGQLGQITVALADAVNQQHQLGLDLNGTLGGAMFSSGSPSVGAAGTNTGSGVIGASVASSSALTGSDYELSYDGTNYTVRRVSNGNTQTLSSLPATVDGVQLTLTSGTPQAGDRWLVQPTRAAASAFSVLITDPARVAAAAAVSSSASLSNLGNATIDPPVANGPTPNVNLRQPVTITFTSATQFSVTGTGTGNPTGVAFTNGATISYNGWSTKIVGTPKAGDTFTIQPTSAGSSDNANVNAIAKLQSGTFVNGYSANSAFGGIVSTVALGTKNMQVIDKANQALATQAEADRQSLSGVNLDEEAADLLRYQQAYQAAAKYIQIASSVFQDLISIGN